HWLEIAVMNVGGDDGTAPADFAANELGLDFFAFGDVSHLFADDAFTGEVHLRHVSGAIGVGLFGLAVFDPIIQECHKSPRRSGVTGASCADAGERKVWHWVAAAATSRA